MIRFEIHGDNLTITDAIRNYIEEKLVNLNVILIMCQMQLHM